MMHLNQFEVSSANYFRWAALPPVATERYHRTLGVI